MAGFDLSMGAWQDAGMAAIKELGRKWIYGIKAFGAKGYKPQKTDLRQGKGWRLTDWPRLGRVIVLNSDMWREMVQRGFLAQPTEAGAVSLYTPDVTGANRQLAQEVASEHIMGQTILNDGSVYQIFGRTPGIPNYRADSLVYACALTGVMGIGEEQQKRIRVASVVIGGRTITTGDKNEQDKGAGNVETTEPGRGAIIGRRRW
jgi:hypothetical protein